jgi:restriction endonuclease S subunit
MKEGYRLLGDFIQPVDERNRDLKVDYLLGVSISKQFIPSIANIVGTDLSSYKIVHTGQFAYGPVTSRNGEKISIALLRDKDCIISSSYTVFEVVNKNALDPEYLMLWFSRPEFDRYARYMSHGSVREIFDWDELCKVELPVPSIDKQRSIVKAYQTITERIELKRRINDNLEAQLSGVYHRFFDAPGNSVPGLISDLGEVVGGATPSTDNPEYFCDDGIAWISPKDLTGTGLKFIYRGELCITESAYNSCSTKLMPAGTVLFTSRAPVGTIAIAMNDICTNQGFKSVIPKKEIGTAFVYYFLKENKQLIESHASGTTFMEVSGTVLKSIPAIVPKPEVASRFAAICMPLFEEQRQNELEIGRLQELRQTLISSISSR